MTPIDPSGTKAVTLVCGSSGSGKTSFAIRYLLNARLSTRFIFDPDGEFAKRLHYHAALEPGDLDWQLCRGWIVFDPSNVFPGRRETAFAFFCDWAWEVSARLPGRKLLVIDEVWRHCSPHAIPPEFATLAQTGRKRQLELMLTTQQPQRLNGAVLNEVTELVCFRLQFERALETVGAFGLDVDAIRSLAPFAFVSMNTNSGAELVGSVRL